MAEPSIYASENRGGAFLPRGEAHCGVVAADVGLDGIKIADEGHAFLCNRRGTVSGDLDQLSAGVGPAIRQLDVRTDPVWRDQPVLSGITVDLQDAAKALQYPFGMLPAQTRCVSAFNLAPLGHVDKWRSQILMQATSTKPRKLSAVLS